MGILLIKYQEKKYMVNFNDLFDDGNDELQFLDESESDAHNCVEALYRDIYQGVFPNCAASAEDGSWCGENDACLANAVHYTGMEKCSFSDCSKAWK